MKFTRNRQSLRPDGARRFRLPDLDAPVLAQAPTSAGKRSDSAQPAEVKLARYRVRSARWWAGYRFVRWRWRLLALWLDVIGWSVFWPARRIRHLLRSSAEGLAACLSGARAEPAGRAPRAILVIQLDHLGDCVLSLGLLRALRASCPRAKLEVLCNRATESFFAGCADVDAVHVVPVTRFDRDAQPGKLGWLWALLCAAWRLRGRFDLALDVRGEFPHALCMWLLGASRRVGWRCGGGGFFLTHAAEYVRGRHEVLSRQALLKAAGIDAPLELVAPRLPPRPTANARRAPSDALLKKLPVPPRSGVPCVALHVGAGTTARRWPVQYWLELVARLIVAYDAQVVLVGSESDREAADLISGQGKLPSVVNLAGRLSLPELADLLRGADLLIGADSGPAHLAAAVGTPVVALFSGANESDQWRPWGERVVVLRHAVPCSPCHRNDCPVAGHPCMTRLTPEQATEAAQQYLGEPYRMAAATPRARGHAATEQTLAPLLSVAAGVSPPTESQCTDDGRLDVARRST